MSDWSQTWIDCSLNAKPIIKSGNSRGKEFKKPSKPIPKNRKTLKRHYNEDTSEIENKFENLKLDEPSSIDELAVSKQKLNELKEWLNKCFYESNSYQSNSTSPFLLLNGPPGSGKTISLKLLCKELDIKFVELPTTSIFGESNLIASSYNHILSEQQSKSLVESEIERDSVKPLGNENQMYRFKRFLFDFNSRKQLIFQDDESNHNRKILVIEDIPSIFFVKPELLHEELASLFKSFKVKLVPIVFIISTTIQGESVEQKILPKVVLNGPLRFHVITFKPITDLSLTKALSNSSLGKKTNKKHIEEVVSTSSGDIRNAFNYLKFKCDNVFSGKSHKKAKYTKNHKNTHKIVVESDRNDPLTLSYGIAKIIYAKRIDTVDESTINFIRNNPKCDKTKLRNPLKETKPETIVERTNLSCDNIIDWVHENFLDFIHDDNLEQYIDCMEILSDSTNLFNDNSSCNINEKNSIENVRASFVTRGMMFNLNRDASSYQIDDYQIDPKKANKFRPLRKPRTFQLNSEISFNKSKLVEFKNFSIESSPSLLMFENEKSLVLDILPSIFSIYPKSLREPDRNFLKYLIGFENHLKLDINAKVLKPLEQLTTTTSLIFNDFHQKKPQKEYFVIEDDDDDDDNF